MPLFNLVVVVFLELRQASENMEGAMKKQTQRIHSIILSARSMTLYFSSLLQSVFKHSTRTLSQPLLKSQFSEKLIDYK